MYNCIMPAVGITMEPMSTRSASDGVLNPADEDEMMHGTSTRKVKISMIDSEQLLLEGSVAARQRRCGCCSRRCWAFSSIAIVALLMFTSACRSSCYSWQVECAAHGSNEPCREGKTGLVCWSVLLPRAMYASTAYNSLMQPSATRRKAQAYFESQLPLVEASARQFECLDYWCRDLRVRREETSFYDMVSLRFDMMDAKQREDPRADDFRLEKSKCEMNRWLAANRLPRHRTYRMWSADGQWGEGEATATTVVDDILANRTGGACPMVIEFCHLTQWDQRKGAVVDVGSQVTDIAGPAVSTIGSLEALRRRSGRGLGPSQLPSPTRGRGACLGGSISPGGLSRFGRCGQCAHCYHRRLT